MYQSMEISIYGFIQDAVAARGWAVVACSDLTESQAQLVAKNREMQVDVVHLPAGAAEGVARDTIGFRVAMPATAEESQVALSVSEAETQVAEASAAGNKTTTSAA